ncbi:MAG TPA: cytochrome c-type biogenesis protein [Longimicrobiales bacterium]|nr:cytochrome c-type biogenesis protein [Longimicrobiales bacterium]
MKTSVSLRLCVKMTLLFLSLAPRINAQTPAAGDSIIEAKTKAISKQLRCPVCQGLSIQDSPSDLSVQMKSVVREMVQQGKSEAEIKAYFVSKYGEWILLAPKPAGMNMLVYLTPFILLVGGGGLIVYRVRKWTNNPAQPEAKTAEELEAEYRS